MTQKKQKSESLWKDAFKRLLKNKMAVVGGVFILILTFIAVFAPLIAPYPYDEGDFTNTYAAPGGKNIMGTDFMGRDVLSRMLYGTRISLMVGTMGAIFAFTVGLFYGTISGYYGGKLDNIMMRIVDILYAFPALLFIILLMVTFKAGFGTEDTRNVFVKAIAGFDKMVGGMFFILLGISLTSWVGLSRLSRGLALSIRETEYVQAARALGCSDMRVMVRHVTPNLIGPMLVAVAMAIPGFIATEAFLSFIGLGINPPMPSWGGMVADGFKSMRSYPHLAIFPGIALAITMLSFNFLGDGLRDALDPKMKQ